MTPEDDARAYELVRVRGLSYSDAGKQFDPPKKKTTVRAAVTREAVRRTAVTQTGVSHVAPSADAGFMARVLAAGPLPDDNADDELEFDTAPAADAADDDLAVDVETMIRRQLKRIERAIPMATETEAQRYSRIAAQLAADLRKIEKEKRDDAGVMTYTLADVAATRADLLKKVADVKHRGLVCAECGRKLRRAEAAGDDDDGEDE